jgi:hypothetical protein
MAIYENETILHSSLSIFMKSVDFKAWRADTYETASAVISTVREFLDEELELSRAVTEDKTCNEFSDFICLLPSESIRPIFHSYPWMVVFMLCAEKLPSCLSIYSTSRNLKKIEVIYVNKFFEIIYNTTRRGLMETSHSNGILLTEFDENMKKRITSSISSGKQKKSDTTTFHEVHIASQVKLYSFHPVVNQDSECEFLIVGELVQSSTKSDSVSDVSGRKQLERLSQLLPKFISPASKDID